MVPKCTKMNLLVYSTIHIGNNKNKTSFSSNVPVSSICFDNIIFIINFLTYIFILSYRMTFIQLFYFILLYCWDLQKQNSFHIQSLFISFWLPEIYKNKIPFAFRARWFHVIIGPFPLTQIVALIWVAIRSATQISATIFIFMCGDRKVAIISAILIAIRAPLIVRLFENNRDYLK